MRIEPIPTLTAELPGDRLVEFYKKLGWDGESMVDPAKVRLCEKDWQDLVGAEMERAKKLYPDVSPGTVAFEVGFLWVNKGPSSGGNTPGMVELLPGWCSAPEPEATV
jgi:hypothetical protein